MKTNLKKMKFALTAGAFALVSGSLAHAAPGFDVNDLNILFALDAAGGKLAPDVALDDRTLSPTLFQDVQAMGTKLGIGTPATTDTEKAAVMRDPATGQPLFFHIGSDKTKWRVVSLRYDSCFPATPKDDTDTTNCVEHVRLITQPVSARRPTGEDTTMHLLFAVEGVSATGPKAGKKLKTGDEKTANTVIGQLAALKALANTTLKVETNGTPLGVHPALANPATQAQFAAAVKAFINRFCTTDKLMVITYMGLEGRGPEPWIFYGGNANVAIAGGPGRWKVDFQPTTGPQTVPQTGQVLPGSDAIVFSNINQPNMDGKTGKVMPHPHAAFINGELMEGSTQNVAALFDKPAAQLTQADKDAVNLVENPKIHAPHNTDCFSCHATNSQARIQNIPPTTDARTFLVPDGITAYIDRDVQPSTSWNTRNFGYFGGKASVSYLTAQSAGDVAFFTNKQLGLDGPGVKCGSAAKQIALRTCTMFGAAGGTQLPFVAAQGQASCVTTAGCSK